MNREGYKLNLSSDSFFTFVSLGSSGEILKGIYFQNIEGDLFNLVLLDYDSEKKTLSDTTISNNGDISKIMATVIQAIGFFFETNNTSSVLIEGKSKLRTLLYNRIIKNNYNTLEKKFHSSLTLLEQVIQTPNLLQNTKINIALLLP